MTEKFSFERYVSWFSLLLLPCLLLPATVNAQEKAALDQFRVTPFLGYRTGGEFEDADGSKRTVSLCTCPRALQAGLHS